MEQVDKTEIEKSKTPESLFSAIEKCSAEPEDSSRESAYREARNAVIRFRKVYGKLPDLPDHKENAVAGLQEIMDWCVRAIDIVDHLVDDMDRDVTRPKNIKSLSIRATSWLIFCFSSIKKSA